MTTIEIETKIFNDIVQLSKQLRISPSGFVNSALKKVVQQYKREGIEAMYADGYTRYPVEDDEFDVADEIRG